MRQIVLDTETTGLDPKSGHRVIEIGCVELVNRQITGNNFHHYLNPEREIDAGAVKIHGLTNDFLSDKQLFSDICTDLTEYLRGAELIIHNAPFDIGFLEHEYQLSRQSFSVIQQECKITDTLLMARRMHPGQRNSLDALRKRYHVDGIEREHHGALLDSTILAYVFLGMTGGQCALFSEDERGEMLVTQEVVQRPNLNKTFASPKVEFSIEEQRAHDAYCLEIERKSGHKALWLAHEDK